MLPDCSRRECHLSGTHQKDHRKTEAMTRLLQAIRIFIPSSETDYNGSYKEEYNCSCQDTMTFASYIGLMSKTNCSAKLPYASVF